MWRIRYVLLALVLVPFKAAGQVDVAFLSSSDGVLQCSRSALEHSRAALLQAREAIDAALSDVDQALLAVRATELGGTVRVAPGPRRGTLASAAATFARRGSEWLESLRPLLRDARKLVAEWSARAADVALARAARLVPASARLEPEEPVHPVSRSPVHAVDAVDDRRDTPPGAGSPLPLLPEPAPPPLPRAEAILPATARDENGSI